VGTFIGITDPPSLGQTMHGGTPQSTCRTLPGMSEKVQATQLPAITPPYRGTWAYGKPITGGLAESGTALSRSTCLST